MSDGLLSNRVILVIEGEGHEGGLSDLGQGCVGYSKVAGVDEKWNVHQPEGFRICVLASLAILSGSEEKEDPNV